MDGIDVPKHPTEEIYNRAHYATAVLLFFLAGVHYLRVHSDLCSEERFSVKHRRVVPQLNTGYKLTSWLTLSTILCFAISQSVFGVWTGFDQGCVLTQAMSASFYQAGKLCMFLIFLIRLDLIYRDCAYSYNRRGLQCLATFLTLYSMGVCVLFTVTADDFEDPCGAERTLLAFVSAGCLVLQDIGFGIAFVVAFVRPLKLILRNVVGNAEVLSEKARRNKGKFYFAALKTSILAVTAMLSTVIVIMLYVFSQAGVSFIYVDVVINVISMMFMTPYYPDPTHYQVCCACCIWCCTPSDEEYTSHVRHRHDPTARSVDTMSAIRLAVRHSQQSTSASGQTQLATLNSNSASPTVDSQDTALEIEMAAKYANAVVNTAELVSMVAQEEDKKEEEEG